MSIKIIVEHGSPANPMFKYFRCVKPGWNYQFTVDPTDTIHNVKQKIQQVLGDLSTITEQRLFSGLAQIDEYGDSHTIQACGLKDGDIVLVMFSMRIYVEQQGICVFALDGLLPSKTIRDVKAAIGNQSGAPIPVEQQRLFLNEHEMGNDDLVLMQIPSFKNGVIFKIVLETVVDDHVSDMDLDLPGTPAHTSFPHDPLWEAMEG